MPRYFSGTNGTVTVFRASAERVYKSATFRPVGFSASGPKAPGAFPVEEITKAQYDALVALKKQRTDGTSPQQSWVANTEIVASKVVSAAAATLTGTASDAEVAAYIADVARRDAEEGIE